MKGKTKKLNCKECGEPVFNVGEDAVAITCSPCVNISLRENISMESSEEEIED